MKMMVNYCGVHNFTQLSNMWRVFDEDQKEKATFYKNASHGKEKKPMTLHCILSLLGNMEIALEARELVLSSLSVEVSSLLMGVLSLLVEGFNLLVLLFLFLRHSGVGSVVRLATPLVSAWIGK